MMINELDKEINRGRSFSHPPIDAKRQIRLLRISLQEDNDIPLQQPAAFANVDYSIEVYDVANLHRTRYRALSYIWGPAEAPEDVHDICISGQPFAVRRNLADFLATAAGKRVAGLFFVDAICIDQLSHAEREAQVQLMEHVFRNADEVVAWLGRLDDDDDDGDGDGDADNVRALARATYDGGDGANRRDSCGCCHHRPRRRRRPEDWTATEWAGFRYLSHHAYWRRIWIVQEIQLASHATVWCGFFTFLLSLFGTSPSSPASSRHYYPETGFAADGRPWVSHESGARLRSPAETVVTHRLRLVPRPARTALTNGTLEEMTAAPTSGAIAFETYQSRVPDLLYQIVRKFGGLACSDPRDRLYGLLGLLHERSRALITPDYSRGIDYAVYQALRAGLLELYHEQWPVLGASTSSTTYYKKGNVHGDRRRSRNAYLAYYCDVRDAFGIPDSQAAALLHRVLDEPHFRTRWLDAVAEARLWLRYQGWDDRETVRFMSDFDELLERARCRFDDYDDYGTNKKPAEGPWLLRFHERQRRAVMRLWVISDCPSPF